MKKKILFISSTLITGISLCYILSTVLFTENETTYTQKDLKSLEKQSSDESQAWLRARYIDVSTGLPVTQSVLDEIQKQISLMPQSKSISFTEPIAADTFLKSVFESDSSFEFPEPLDALLPFFIEESPD